MGVVMKHFASSKQEKHVKNLPSLSDNLGHFGEHRIIPSVWFLVSMIKVGFHIYRTIQQNYSKGEQALITLQELQHLKYN